MRPRTRAAQGFLANLIGRFGGSATDPVSRELTVKDMLAIEVEARVAALGDIAEKIKALREFETIEPRYAKERAWNRAIDRVLDIVESQDTGALD